MPQLFDHPYRTRPWLGGTARSYRFPNGYEASVVCHSGSYGGNEGLWELAVIGKDGDLDYTTPITNDVLGWLTQTQVEEALQAISNLP